ncbi:IPT/TIG domain-containing protein [Chitiniphilus shinanonensis]|uniref:IPT/TIG domain-containing protein n=1 Tax=Chitiniphilus shinanonensis TaxID=553088 RepID=UPI003340E337
MQVMVGADPGHARARVVGERFVHSVWSKAVLVLCAVLFGAPAAADVTVAGTLAQDTVWRASDGAVLVTADVMIPAGVTLQVEAGVTVQMASGTSLITQGGSIRALGSAMSPIIVTASAGQDGDTAAPGAWGHWVFNAGGESKLEHVRLSYGKGIQVNGAAPVFNHLTITAMQGPAVRLDASASPVGTGNQAQDNDLNAIVVSPGVISGSVTWGLRGIPYLLESGVLSVGEPPAIHALTPNNVQRGKTVSMSVAGQRLIGLTQLRFDRQGIVGEVVGTPGADAATIEVTVAADAQAGPVALSALTDAGELALADALDILALQPLLAALMPATVTVAQGPAEVTIYGENFTETSVASLDGDLLPTRFVNAAQLVATLPNQTQAASRMLSVRNEDVSAPGGHVLSNTLILSVAASPLSLTPETATLAVGATQVLTVGLAHPAPADGVALELVSSDTTVVSVPSPLLFAAGEQEKAVSLVAAKAGDATVTVRGSGFTSAEANVIVVAPPRLDVEPMPLAIPPDGVSRPFSLKLSRADTADHVLTLASADTDIAEVTPAQSTLVAGQTSLTASIKGKQAGQTRIVVTSPSLAKVEVPVFVTADYRALSVSFSPLLGVVVSQAPPPQPEIGLGPVASRLLGIQVGAGVTGLAPDRMPVGASQWLTLTGTGLADIRAIALSPVEDITLGVPEAAADGRSVRVLVTVAPQAQAGPRRLILTDGQGRTVPTTMNVERLLIVRPVPEIHSISPFHGLAGSKVSLTVRGKHLQDLDEIRMQPGDGLVVDAIPVIAADGASMTLNVDVAPTAQVGEHVLVVGTPAGKSNEAAGVHNTFKVVQRIDVPTGPIVSGVVGVRVGEERLPAETGGYAVARGVGVIRGGGIAAVSPQVGVTGSSFNLRLSGSGLSGVSGVEVQPSTGVTLGSVTIAPDGSWLEMPVTVAADAPLTVRDLRIRAGERAVHFTTPELERLRIIAPPPVVESVSPNYLILGEAPVTLTVRGRNLGNSSNVRLLPNEGLSISPPVVATDGDSLTVTINAQLGAQTGPRALVVTTPAADSTTEVQPANRVTLTEQVLSVTSPVVSSVLGVRVGTEASGWQIDALALSSIVGVRIGDEPGPPAPQAYTSPLSSAPLGISVGTVIETMGELRGFVPGASGTLTFTGRALQAIDTVVANPADGITLGTLAAAADGSTLSLPIAVAADALPGSRGLYFHTASSAVAVTGPWMPHVKISEGAPVLASVSPIVLKQGETTSLVFRGTRLRLTEALRFTPADGIEQAAAAQWETDAFGEKLTVPVRVAADAPLVTRVVQLVVAGAESDGVAGPTNTLTIVAP